MKDLKFIQLQKDNEEHYKLFESLMIPYNKELDAHRNRVTPEDFILKITRGMLRMQGPHDRHLELCYENDELVGFLYGKVDHENHKGFIKPGYGYIMEFYVLPECRRKGFGHAMFNRLYGHFASHGTKTMYLTADPVTGKPFWEVMGFADTGILSPENGMPIYEKDISPSYRAELLNEQHIAFISDLMNSQHILTALHAGHTEPDEWKEFFKTAQSDQDEINFIVFRGSDTCAWLKINGLENPEKSWISMLVVDERHRRRGAGKFALEYAEDFIRSKGKNKICVNTTADNIPARNLYSGRGYRNVIQKAGTCPDGTAQIMCVFEKSLIL